MNGRRIYIPRSEMPDALTVTPYIKSVIEMRSVYSNLTDREFVDWYHRKFKMRKDDLEHLMTKYQLHRDKLG
ncbi:hypothetical protein D3C76_550340 [compost metagenome]